MALATSTRVASSRHQTLVHPAARRTVGRRGPRSLLVVSATGPSYFVAKNVFKVKEDSAEAFEDIWKTRESRLKEFPGFMQFALLKCTNIPGKYVSETHWASKEEFQAWAKSPQFKASHVKVRASTEEAAPGPNMMEMVEGPPVPEFYETVTTTTRD